MTIQTAFYGYACDLEQLREHVDEMLSIVRRGKARTDMVELDRTVRIELQQRDTVPPTFALIVEAV